MSRYNRCNECFNMKCVFVTGERTDFDTSECPDFRPMTNADRIRSMSDEELALWLDLLVNRAEIYGESKAWLNDTPRYFADWLDWLKSPVEVSND